MINEETFYSIECDGCKAEAENGEGHCYWADLSMTKENARESDWHTTDDDKHYCPNCHSFDDNDELVLTPQRPNPHLSLRDE